MIRAATAFLLPTFLAGMAMAQDGGFYLKAYGGLSTLADTDVSVAGAFTDLETSFDGGTLAGGAFGYDYPASPFAAELEFAYRSGESGDGAATGDFASTSVMVNAVYGFGGGGAFTPYLGAGLGYVTEIDYDLTGAGEREFSDRGGLAGQIFAGAAYKVTERVSLYGEARYFTAGSRTLTDAGGATLDADYSTVDILAGVRFDF